jgi:hypothetical protein
MKELKTSMKKVKEATKAKTTYAQAVVAATTYSALNPKHERARHEVTLVATSDDTKENLAKNSYRVITKKIQMAIDDNVQHDEKPVLLGVSKPTKLGTIRIRCETENEAKTLREMDWETAVGGLQARKPKYGVVVHKIDKDHYNALIQNADEVSIKHVETANALPISNIAPLLRKDNNDSIIILSTDPHAADRCIKQGIYINYRASTTLKSTRQNYKPHNATTAADTVITWPNARTNTDVENAERTTNHVLINTGPRLPPISPRVPASFLKSVLNEML